MLIPPLVLFLYRQRVLTMFWTVFIMVGACHLLPSWTRLSNCVSSRTSLSCMWWTMFCYNAAL